MADFYWCLTHQRVERGTTCRAVDRLGPYADEASARAWAERHEARADAWEAEDERWDDEEEDDDDW
jgi:hypothetical protein